MPYDPNNTIIKKYLDPLLSEDINLMINSKQNIILFITSINFFVIVLYNIF